MNPERRRSLAALAALGAGVGSAFAPALRAAEAPLTLGLAPYLSPAALLAAFRPVREHLEHTLGRPVNAVTAKDFRSLVEATRTLEYDLVLLPAHVARLAIMDWRHEPLAGTVETLQVLVLVRADSPVTGPAGLRGGKAGMLDALSLTSTVGRRWLHEQGLADAVTVLELPSINSALYALDRGEVAMIVAGGTQLMGLPASTPRTDRVLATIGDIPGPIYVARPGLPAETLARLRAALLGFVPDPARPLTAANSALRPPSAEQLAALDAYAALARQALALPR